MKSNSLVIIPARGGSKRLPRKNILPLNGKPLIEWTIEAAQAANFENIVVSSDDEEILNLVVKFPKILFLRRPVELASDIASTNDVILNVLDELKENFDNLLLLQPTSPLRTVNDLNGAFELFEKGKYTSVVSVTEVDHPTDYTMRLPDNNSLDNFFTKLKQLPQRSQDFEKEYRLNGAIYITKVEDFKKNKSLFNYPSCGFIMSRKNSIDIDELFDFRIAEALFQYDS
ncbi:MULTISPECIES: cytidylyltransferase domain-containing protein [Acinetobacter]|uniref:Acylneuraminate cytidylyltransferase family protein n=1 Tax=Acinetobacter higginsii TaxID=70347 RepID=N9T3A1_9GAMM|nr:MULTISPECIES: acylneuraminate cytidylyltransferase family protein [Acinetobacter]ENX61566.1 hypothetical protein F902_00603 [Acinetobacter higginsii]